MTKFVHLGDMTDDFHVFPKRREGIMYNITEEEKTMTREQQEEVRRIITSLGGEVVVTGVRGCANIYTTDIEKILALGASIYFHKGEMRISNWQPDPPPKPEPKKMKIKSFNRGEYNLELEIANDHGSDHSHIRLWRGSDNLGYMHISSTYIHWIPAKATKQQAIEIGRDC